MDGTISMVPIVRNTCEYWWNSNWFVGIVCGVVTGFVVWRITASYITHKQRAFIKAILSEQYKRFRQSVVRVFLAAEGCMESDPYALTEHLCNKDAFRARYPASSERYAQVLNGMEESYLRLKMARLFQDFSTTIVQYMNSNTALKQKAVRKMLAEADFLAEQAFEFEYTGKVDNPTDRAYGIIAWWNMIDGDLDRDIIQEAIDAL